MMNMREKSNIEQHERKENEEKEKSITYIWQERKGPSYIYDREGKILSAWLITREKESAHVQSYAYIGKTLMTTSEEDVGHNSQQFKMIKNEASAP